MAEQRQCFIIMPITTPESVRDKYRDGAEHFKHVLDCLLIPAVRKANFKPLPPIAKGADLIHAEIVKQLESADLVLCDMSILNANVFFEFGIRTALNKAVCVVKDELTEKVPFDTGILNHHEYRSTLNPWELEGEIDRIAEHIEVSFTRSKGTNPLWRYFGVKTEAAQPPSVAGAEDKLDMLFMQMDSIRQRLDSLPWSGDGGGDYTVFAGKEYMVMECLRSDKVAGQAGFNSMVKLAPGHYVVFHNGQLPVGDRHRLSSSISGALNVKVDFVPSDRKEEVMKEIQHRYRTVGSNQG